VQLKNNTFKLHKGIGHYWNWKIWMLLYITS